VANDNGSNHVLRVPLKNPLMRSGDFTFYVVNKKYINNFFKKDQQWYVNLKQINKDIPVSRRQKVEIEGKLNYSIFEED